MAEDQKAVSFNPDDASGLFDNARAIISKVLVDFFTSKKGEKFVNVDVTFKTPDQEITEHYLLGDATKWAPNAAKTGALPVVEGAKIWNKSDVFRFVKSVVDAGFPKAKVQGDLSVLVGLDVQVDRVTIEGSTRKDQNGVERPRQTLLVSKLYTDAAAIASGAYAKAGGAKPAAAAKAPKATAAAAPAAAATTDISDEYVSDLLVNILSAGPVDRTALGQKAFILITKDKAIAGDQKAGTRAAVTAKFADDAFIDGLVESGLIAKNGKALEIAA